MFVTVNVSACVLGWASHVLDLRLRIQDAVDKINVDRHQLRCQCEIKVKVKDNVTLDGRYNDYFCEQPPNPN